MNWNYHHSISERHASDAQIAELIGQHDSARMLYAEAAAAEECALDTLEPGIKRFTRGVTLVSAVSLWFKAGRMERAERLAHDGLNNPKLPEFAHRQLRALLASAGETAEAP